ncbi:MAG: M20/M25/M40 family metallo-hydrolase, partial [Deltaproteobacteria bacterium]|nr:M20/M25/M40 family metallo-hydrolase [Deltaproteobacteria bacterium]
GKNLAFAAGTTFYQHFDLLNLFEGISSQSLKIIEDGKVTELAGGKDFNAMAVCGGGDVEGGIVYAGFGVSAPDFRYDDYKGVDVKGKVALVLRGAAALKGEGASSLMHLHSDIRYKILNARIHGASAVIFVDPSFSPRGKSLLPPEESGEDVFGAGANFPCFSITRERLSVLFGNGGIDKLEEETIMTQAPNSKTLDGIKIQASAVRKETGRLPTQNLIGVKNGKSEKAIIIGAHYDHIGLGGIYSAERNSGGIHNGADDNASGVAALLGIIERFSGKKTEKTLIFAAFGAEETGLDGSAFFLNSGVVRKEDVGLMINLDMVGRMTGNEVFIGGLETVPEIRPAVMEKAGKLGLSVREMSASAVLSDHTPFLLAGIPAIFISTGMHEDYHKPSDDAEKINFEGISKIVELVSGIIETASPF